MNVAVVAFTRDLRVRDHPALTSAARAGRVVPLFVFDDRLVRRLRRSANRLQFLVDSLQDLDTALRERGGALVVRRGDWAEEVAHVTLETGADVVHVSNDVSPLARRRLDALRDLGERRGFAIVTHPGVTVVEPGELRTGTGTAYQMFTPYYRRWKQSQWRAPVHSPRTIAVPDGVATVGVPALRDLTDVVPSPSVVRGGETTALAQLRLWSRRGLERYAELHDAPAADATSHSSAALHFGCLSPLEAATRLRGRPGGESFTRQLCWRDFFQQLLASRPQLAWESMRPRGRPAGAVDAAFAAWQTGRTGYPFVDAGMRQLQREGFVHNRVRMVVASFLAKDLDVPWQLGAQHFLDLLVDGDIANNQMNWQWAAGTGTDTNPHRVFNPVRQSERFDADGAYIRRYVPELGDVPAELVHDPPARERQRVGYPDRIVDHAGRGRGLPRPPRRLRNRAGTLRGPPPVAQVNSFGSTPCLPSTASVSAAGSSHCSNVAS